MPLGWQTAAVQSSRVPVISDDSADSFAELLDEPSFELETTTATVPRMIATMTSAASIQTCGRRMDFVLEPSAGGNALVPGVQEFPSHHR